MKPPPLAKLFFLSASLPVKPPLSPAEMVASGSGAKQPKLETAVGLCLHGPMLWAQCGGDASARCAHRLPV